MSSWTIVTLRGRPAADYEYTRSESQDRWDATADIVATMEADDRVRNWTTWNSHVYAYLSRAHDREWTDQLLQDYAPMADSAVVLDANDTSDTGSARYYPKPEGIPTDEYRETQAEDGNFVGHLALSVINARHGMIAADPFHPTGQLDKSYVEDGKDMAERWVGS